MDPIDDFGDNSDLCPACNQEPCICAASGAVEYTDQGEEQWWCSTCNVWYTIDSDGYPTCFCS